MATTTHQAGLDHPAAEPDTAPSPEQSPPRRRTGQWAAWGFLAPIVIYMLVFYAYPLYRNIDLSLRDYTIRSFINGNATFIGFQNYLTAYHNPTSTRLSSRSSR